MASSVLRQSTSMLVRATPRRYVSSILGDRATKLRTLVDIYHQSEDYITPENLSAKIDVEFAYKDLPPNDDTLEKDLNQLKIKIARRKTAPRIRPDDPTSDDAPKRADNPSITMPPSGGVWSDALSKRRYKVRSALYGVADRNTAGLEVVEDAHNEKERKR